MTRSKIAEAPGTSSTSEAAEACPCLEYSLLEETFHQPAIGHGEKLAATEEEEAEAPSPNGFLIVFQNDEPTTVTVTTEFIPFDQRKL